MPPTHEPSDDESIDELAGDGFLTGVPTQVGTAESLRNELIAADGLTRESSKRSFQTAREVLEQISTSASATIALIDQSNNPRPALAAKTTNAQVRTAKASSRIGKANISAPLPTPGRRTREENSPESSPFEPVAAIDSRQPPQSNRVEFSRRISDLIQEAARQEAETQRHELTYQQELAKPSPRERAKASVIRASQTVKKKWKSRTGQRKALQVAEAESMLSPKSIFATHSPSPRRRGAFKRRVAEGVNLSNPKIQALTGDSSVPWKPLPIYESMRSRMERASLEEDPFQDDPESVDSPLSPLPMREKPSQNFSMHSQRSVSNASRGLDEPQSTRPSKDIPVSSVDKHIRTFSPEISGLAQHTDTLLFSSSPEATSTPTSIWRSQPSSLRKIRKAVSHRKSPRKSQSASSTPVSKTITASSRSIKRRSANEDLRSPNTPMTKKARLSPASGTENLPPGLTTSVSAMNTNDVLAGSRSPSPKLIRGKKARSPQSKKNKKRGLGIFDVHITKGKGKAGSEAAPAPEDVRPFSFGQGSHFSRPSFSRPHSLFFGGRESRAFERAEFAKLEDREDEMEIDELA